MEGTSGEGTVEGPDAGGIHLVVQGVQDSVVAVVDSPSRSLVTVFRIHLALQCFFFACIFWFTVIGGIFFSVAGQTVCGRIAGSFVYSEVACRGVF